MNPKHLGFLQCPHTREGLEIVEAEREDGGLIRNGVLANRSGNHTYKIVNFIPRFVTADNYAGNFGFQWKKHAKTQYDRWNGTTISKTRLTNETRWGQELSGEKLLEVGSGAGRFTEHLVATGAMVVSFDYSNAVEVNYEMNAPRENLLLVQASVYEMPFRREWFDKIMCLGVLQHTPDVEESFKTLVHYLAPGGRLVVDVYRKDTGLRGVLKKLTQTKYWARPFTKGMEAERLYRLCSGYVNTMWPVARAIRRIPWLGEYVVRSMLIADFGNDYQDDTQRREWAVLNTFDWLSPAFDSPQTIQTLKQWFEEARLSDIDVHYGYNGIEGRGRMPDGEAIDRDP